MPASDVIPPLNGVKTHPLTKHARGQLRRLAKGPMAAQDINAGVTNRLLRGGLVEIFQAPSPYASRHGAMVNWLRLTEAGRGEAGN